MCAFSWIDFPFTVLFSVVMRSGHPVSLDWARWKKQLSRSVHKWMKQWHWALLRLQGSTCCMRPSGEAVWSVWVVSLCLFVSILVCVCVCVCVRVRVELSMHCFLFVLMEILSAKLREVSKKEGEGEMGSWWEDKEWNQWDLSLSSQDTSLLWACLTLCTTDQSKPLFFYIGSGTWMTCKCF